MASDSNEDSPNAFKDVPAQFQPIAEQIAAMKSDRSGEPLHIISTLLAQPQTADDNAQERSWRNALRLGFEVRGTQRGD